MPFCHNCAHFGAAYPKPTCHLKQPKTWSPPEHGLDLAYGYIPDRPSCFQPKAHAPKPATNRPRARRR
jgi:hypothetical protein